jgi:acyl carrier protein
MIDRDVVKQRLSGIFREIFQQPGLELHDSLTTKDVPGWDSIQHLNLVMAVEREFGMSLTTRDVRSMQNVGDLMTLVETKATR